MATKSDAIAAGLPADHAHSLELAFPNIDWAAIVAAIKQAGLAAFTLILQIILGGITPTPAPALKATEQAGCEPDCCDHRDCCCRTMRELICGLKELHCAEGKFLCALECCHCHEEQC